MDYNNPASLPGQGLGQRLEAHNPLAGARRSKPASTRVLAPDLLRGLLALIMLFAHTANVLHTWSHGTGLVLESDGQIVQGWSSTPAYIARTLTHLCASGFTFLLGMGVVFLGRSRKNLGWTSLQLVWHFAVRCIALTAVTVVLGLVTSGGRIWFMNAVLFSLAINYLLIGLLWLVIDTIEDLWTVYHFGTYAEGLTQPLLGVREASNNKTQHMRMFWALSNALLLVLGIVAIFWNVWQSDTQGTCIQRITEAATTTTTSPSNPFLRVWFWTIGQGDPASHIQSGYPPLAWTSFAIVGLIYAHIATDTTILTARITSATGHVSAAMLFLTLFVLTRVFQFGNLSTDCLQTPDQAADPQLENQYLASAKSFFYVIKHTPDMAYFSLTMAINLLLMAVFTLIPADVAKRATMLLDFGRSALFFYVVHCLLLFGVLDSVVATIDTGGDDNVGSSGLVAYCGTLVVLLLIFWPMCRWYSNFKSKQPADSLWRFF